MRRVAGMVAVGLLVSTSALADPASHHESVDSTAYPWSSLAKLFNSAGGSCTGAVVARDKVLTAGHCVYAFRTRRFLPPEALHVLLGYERGDYRIHARVLRYRLGPGYDPQAEQATAASDWVILDLAAPLPLEVRPLDVVRLSGPDPKVTLAGFARDRAYMMTADRDCRVTGTVHSGQLIAHDCLVQPGDSGAPLLRQPGPGTEARIVGVVVGLWHLPGGDVGIAAPPPPELLVDRAPAP